MRWLLFASVFLIVGVATIGGLWYYQKATRWNTFADPTTRVTFVYPPDLIRQSLTEADQKDKIIFRATERAGEPAVLVTARYEEGLRALANLLKRDLRDILVENSHKTLPERFPVYQKVSEQQFDLSGKPAAEIIFTYEGPAGERVKQRLLIVVRDDDLALYLAAQSRESDFDTLKTRFLNRLFTSLKFE